MNVMRLWVREPERGGIASVLGPSPLFPVPGPTACVRAGGRREPCPGPGCGSLVAIYYVTDF